MDWRDETRRELDFLRGQMQDTDHKIARLNDALSACQDRLEADGLRAMLHNALLEREVLNELIMNQVDASALSLQTTILQRTERLQRAAVPARAWQRGRPTPPAYWEARVKRAFLTDLLRRYHAWLDGRPYYPLAKPAGSAGLPGRTTQSANGSTPDRAPAHPWYPPAPGDGTPSIAAPVPTAGTTDELAALREQIVEALDHAGYPERHLEIVVQPEGVVLVTGYAHSRDERERAYVTIMEFKGVQEVISDIQVVTPDLCPICHPRPA